VTNDDGRKEVEKVRRSEGLRDCVQPMEQRRGTKENGGQKSVAVRKEV
jgi:hypothetical protein